MSHLKKNVLLTSIDNAIIIFLGIIYLYFFIWVWRKWMVFYIMSLTLLVTIILIYLYCFHKNTNIWLPAACLWSSVWSSPCWFIKVFHMQRWTYVGRCCDCLWTKGIVWLGFTCFTKLRYADGFKGIFWGLIIARTNS